MPAEELKVRRTGNISPDICTVAQLLCLPCASLCMKFNATSLAAPRLAHKA